MSLRSRILKSAEPSQLDRQVDKALADIASANEDLKLALQSLRFCSALQIDTGLGTGAIVVFVPVRQLIEYRQVMETLVPELENRFSGHRIVFVGKRTVVPKPKGQIPLRIKRPRSKTVKFVHEKMLEDVLYPAEIVGKRIRMRTGEPQVTKVLLDSRDQSVIEDRLDTLSKIYRKLTGTNTVFEFSMSD